MIDRRLQLVDEPLFPDNEYTPNIDRILPAHARAVGAASRSGGRRRAIARELSGLDLSRAQHPLPDRRRRRSDPRMHPRSPVPFVGQRPSSTLIGLLSQASDLGLRVIVDRQRAPDRPRRDDRAAAASASTSFGDHADALGQPSIQRQNSRPALQPAACRSAKSVKTRRTNISAVGEPAWRGSGPLSRERPRRRTVDDSTSDTRGADGGKCGRRGVDGAARGRARGGGSCCTAVIRRGRPGFAADGRRYERTRHGASAIAAQGVEELGRSGAGICVIRDELRHGGRRGHHFVPDRAGLTMTGPWMAGFLRRCTPRC